MTTNLARATVALLFVIALLLAVVAGRGALWREPAWFPPDVNVTVEAPQECAHPVTIGCAPAPQWLPQGQ